MSIYGQDCLATAPETTVKFVSRFNLKLLNKSEILTPIIDFKKFVRGVTFNKQIEIKYHVKDVIRCVN